MAAAPAAPAAAPSQVLVFGDSWAMWPMVSRTWPVQLAALLGARALNFAVPGSRTDQLLMQLEGLLTSTEATRTATGELHGDTVAVIHTAGNDFMQRLGQDLFSQMPGKPEAETIRQLMEMLYGAGVRRFVVSDVPLAPCVPGIRFAGPMLQGQVDAGRLEHLGIERGDSVDLAVELQATALHDQWDDMIGLFREAHPDAVVTHFDEAFALSRLRDELGEGQFDSSFFDMTLIHPTQYGHDMLAKEAHKCMQQVAAC